jgi:hypothetical protein
MFKRPKEFQRFQNQDLNSKSSQTLGVWFDLIPINSQNLLTWSTASLSIPYSSTGEDPKPPLRESVSPYHTAFFRHCRQPQLTCVMKPLPCSLVVHMPPLLSLRWMSAPPLCPSLCCHVRVLWPSARARRWVTMPHGCGPCLGLYRWAERCTT